MAAETASKSIYKLVTLFPQTATKLTKTCGSEFGALLWRQKTYAAEKTAIWVHNHSPSRGQQP